jgi:hypothetical protein
MHGQSAVALPDTSTLIQERVLLPFARTLLKKIKRLVR